MRNARALQRIAIILAVLFVLSLLPVMAVAFYNHPRADDYTYGAVLRKVIDAGQGLPEAVAAIAAYVRSTYARWAGVVQRGDAVHASAGRVFRQCLLADDRPDAPAATAWHGDAPTSAGEDAPCAARNGCADFLVAHDAEHPAWCRI